VIGGDGVGPVLDHLGLGEEAALHVRGLGRAGERPETRTPDVGGTATAGAAAQAAAGYVRAC
jgi:hypothetical protein